MTITPFSDPLSALKRNFPSPKPSMCGCRNQLPDLPKLWAVLVFPVWKSLKPCFPWTQLPIPPGIPRCRGILTANSSEHLCVLSQGLGAHRPVSDLLGCFMDFCWVWKLQQRTHSEVPFTGRLEFWVMGCCVFGFQTSFHRSFWLCPSEWNGDGA